MAIIRDPILKSAALTELHPTQITVGTRGVRERRGSWRSKGKKKRAEFLGKHLIPVILGPDKPGRAPIAVCPHRRADGRLRRTDVSSLDSRGRTTSGSSPLRFSNTVTSTCLTLSPKMCRPRKTSANGASVCARNSSGV
jgi:hypothetical protein